MIQSLKNEAKKFVLPKVVVVIISWNGKENTRECLDSVVHLNYENYETVVVDNASNDGSQEFLKRNYAEITLIENPVNLGFGGGLNVGIREAMRRGSDYILCLNNDVVLDKNVLSELVRFGEISSRIGGLCPLEYDYNQNNRIICAGGVIRFVRGKLCGYGKLDKGQFNRAMITGLLSGPAMMFKVKALLDVGLFDTSYFYGPEDQDIALRLIKKRYNLVFVPSAKVWHKRRGATKGKITPLNEYFHVRNYLLFVKKNATGFDRFFSVVYFWFCDFSIIFFRNLISGKCNSLNAIMAGLIWHINNALVPSDSQMVELLSNLSRKTCGKNRQ
jgi:GT2 family glycosyltransferase